MVKKGFVSVDLGGTNIACAVADESLNLLGESKVPTESHLGPDGVMKRMGDAVEELCAAFDIAPLGLGLGVPGLVDLTSGRTIFLPNFPTQWKNVEVAKPLQERLNCPVALLNDARMATLGELVFGMGKGKSDLTFAFFTIGTGIGGGVAVDGKLRLGSLGAAGEIGHQTIRPDGPRCGCGNRGCLEAIASGTALVGRGAWLVRSGRAPRLRELCEGDLNRVTPFLMVDAARLGDEAVAEVIRDAAEAIGIGVANVATTLHPDLVVLGGGVSEMGEILLEGVRKTVHDRVRMFPSESIRIEISTLGEMAGIWGGLALARNPELATS